MSEEIEFLSAAEVSARAIKVTGYICPKGHKQNTVFAIYDAAGETEEQFCMVCFAEWVRANVPKVERTG